MAYEVEGVYGLKPSTSAGFPASGSELALGDWGDQPENFRRVWGTFGLDDLKGFIRLEKVVAGESGCMGTCLNCLLTSSGPRSLRAFSRLPEEETEAESNGHEVDHPSSDRPVIAFSDTWGHRFRSGDVLVCSWRGTTAEEVIRAEQLQIAAGDNERLGVNRLNQTGPFQTFLRNLPAPTSASVSTFGQPAPRPLRYLRGECRITLKDFNEVEVAWTKDGRTRQYQGQRVMGRLVEVRSRRPLELRDGFGCTLEDFEHR